MRQASACAVLLGLFALMGAAWGQTPTPGQNINMVSGLAWPGGDPFLQRQNEPSLAVSSRNLRHVFAGANDYRTVDLPYPDVASDEDSPCVDSTGKPAICAEPWLGVFKSFNGGETWQSVLLPGYPQDNSPEGLASPLKLNRFPTASDPIVRAGTNGLFYYAGMAFDRATGRGAMFVARYIDLNNKENGDVTQGRDPIRYVGTAVTAFGSSSAFLDKPAMAVDIPRSGAGTCSLQVNQDGNVVSQSFPAGKAYLVYTRFTSATSSQIVLQRSTNCGATWSAPIILSGGFTLNQGATVQIDPETGIVYVAWRVFHSANQKDALAGVASLDGVHFTPAFAVVKLPAFDPVTNPRGPSFFDQGTTGTSFRTNAYPALAVDDSGFPFIPGRIYLAWSQRGIGPNGDARIMMMVISATEMEDDDALSIPPPFPVDSQAVADDMTGTFSIGHQFMPQISTAGGKIMVAYYDQRLDHTLGEFVPYNPFLADTLGRFYLESRETQTDSTPVFTPFIDDFALTNWRHTLEVRIAEAIPSNLPTFVSRRVTSFREGTLPDDETGTVVNLQQLQLNPPNLPMFQQGHVPFLGDYIEVSGSVFRSSLNSTGQTVWKYDSQSPAPVHHVSWTSNQDVVKPPNGDWTQYTPPALGPGTGAGQSVFDPTAQRSACTTGFEGTRNQNIYDSRVTQGLVISSLQNSKPLSSTLQRAFAITVQNFTNSDRSFRLSIANQPVGGMASFVGAPNPLPTPLPPPVITLDVTIAAHSGIARTVFASSTNPVATITVNVNEISTPGGTILATGLSSFVLLNAEGTVPPLVTPDGTTTSIGTVEIYNPGVSNPGVSNPNVSNPGVSNPGVSNPGVSNPGVSNPNVSNLDVGNPGVSNPGVSNVTVSNPGVSNPGVSNPNVSNAPVSDATYTLTNNGNTSAAYTIKIVGNSPIPLQLILTKTYGSPVSVNCVLTESNTDILQANINNAFIDPNVGFPGVSNPGVSNPGVSNATIAVAPGESFSLTLRGYVDVPTMRRVIGGVTPVVVPQAANTDSNTRFVAVPGTTLSPGSLFIVNTSLPDANLGDPYSATLSAIDGVAPYSWRVSPLAEGPGLPFGFSWDPATGIISNITPAENLAGTYTFLITVTDSVGNSASKQLSIVVATAAVSPFSGGTTDPSGDAGPAPNPDLVSGAVAVTADGTVTLAVHFAPGTFTSNSAAQFLLDTDQNSATGHPGVNSSCQTDAGVIGDDYLVELHSVFDNNRAVIFKYTGTCNHFALIGTATVTPLADGMQVSIPLSMLVNTASATTSGPATSGPWNFKVVSFSSLGNGGFTGVLDVMPDVGLTPASTAPPSPN